MAYIGVGDLMVRRGNVQKLYELVYMSVCALLLRNHALMHRIFVLSCLDERTACIYIFSSHVCTFS